MALALEKTFLQKVAQLPQKEVEVFPHAAKGKAKKISAAGNELTWTHAGLTFGFNVAWACILFNERLKGYTMICLKMCAFL